MVPSARERFKYPALAPASVPTSKMFLPAEVERLIIDPMVVLDLIVRLLAGELVPIPTFPFERTVKSDALVEDAMLRSGVSEPAVPWTVRRDVGVVEPIPRLPEDRSVKKDAPEDDATSMIEDVDPENPCKVRRAEGVDVPIPRRELVLSQKKLALFCERSPPVVTNGTDPAVSAER